MKAQILTIPVKAWGKIGQCQRRLFHIFAYLALLSYLGFQHFCIFDRWSLCFEDISNSWVSSCLHSKAWLNYSIWTENNFRGGCHFANLKVWSNNLLVVPLPWGETIIEVPMWIYKLKIIFVGAAIFFLRAVECTAVMIYCYIQSIPLFSALRQRSILKSCVINDCLKTALNFIWILLPEYFRCYSCLLCDFQRIFKESALNRFLRNFLDSPGPDWRICCLLDGEGHFNSTSLLGLDHTVHISCVNLYLYLHLIYHRGYVLWNLDN